MSAHYSFWTDDPGEQSEVVVAEFEGNPTRLQALGMLRMVEHQILNESDSE